MERLYAPWRMAYVEQPQPPKPDSTGCVFCDAAASADDVVNLIVHRGKSAFVILRNCIETIQEAPQPPIMGEQYGAKRHLVPPLLGVRGRLKWFLHNLLGTVAGAGIADHLHLHVVPRWNGDTNFMPVLTDVKVMPDSLEHSGHLIRDAWPV